MIFWWPKSYFGSHFGSGFRERNVKFREPRIPISKKNFKTRSLIWNLVLKALDLDAEMIVYYWAAIDNKRLQQNFSRSDTYFLNLWIAQA